MFVSITVTMLKLHPVEQDPDNGSIIEGKPKVISLRTKTREITTKPSCSSQLVSYSYVDKDGAKYTKEVYQSYANQKVLMNN